MDDHDDFAFEPVPGLPERLPAGEAMLWQGSPEWRPLAVSAFHVRKVAFYFGLLAAWQLIAAWSDGASLPRMATIAGWLVVLAAVSVGILCMLAYGYARGTIYTLTSRRLVIRSGLALPITLNLPLAMIDTASVNRLSEGFGGIALAVSKPNRIAWLALWPNARPWNFTHPQPMLRCIADVELVASMLATALAAAPAADDARQSVTRPAVTTAAVPVDATGATLAA